MFQLTVGEACKIGIFAEFLMRPAPTFRVLVVGCLINFVLPAAVYHLRYRTWFGWMWAVRYSFLSVFILSWISLWGLMSASRSGWLTRDVQVAEEPSGQQRQEAGPLAFGILARADELEETTSWQRV
ncbi:MAG: hypothetical protein P4L55_13075 [Syntrophobacteraceae bacterium]|nr:hypothetical protein [Syntrophobacteraceae bacterium]